MAARPRRGRLKLQKQPSPELPQQLCDPPQVEEAENGRPGSNNNFGQKDLPQVSSPGRGVPTITTGTPQRPPHQNVTPAPQDTKKRSRRTGALQTWGS
ncbi:hypothetical protein PoB_002675800 [Plakobranchus ocellatus]|uniref:Uncharacterized protein n=1 Tax=Plakobranchus ocellatus TaxID=259542 RepID=A0AAV4A0T2_9GAST|nr:hypothetical protein PoB_002675800 [Plakobranchus ocellatus]